MDVPTDYDDDLPVFSEKYLYEKLKKKKKRVAALEKERAARTALLNATNDRTRREAVKLYQDWHASR